MAWRLAQHMSKEEWCGCLYLYLKRLNPSYIEPATLVEDFDASVWASYDLLCKNGYSFKSIPDDDAMMAAPCEEDFNCDLYALLEGKYLGNPFDVLERGRNFIKQHVPDLLNEDDETWREEMRDAATSLFR